jgi:hypothetical protein
MKRLALFLWAALATTPAVAQTNTSWDGTWNGSWGGRTAAKIIIAGGRAVECDYRGTPQRVGDNSNPIIALLWCALGSNSCGGS